MQQSLDSAVISKTDATSVTDRTTRELVENDVGEAVLCWWRRHYMMLMNVMQRKEADDENSRIQLQQLEGLLCLQSTAGQFFPPALLTSCLCLDIIQSFVQSTATSIKVYCLPCLVNLFASVT